MPHGRIRIAPAIAALVLLFCAAARAAQELEAAPAPGHRGPAVAEGESGPARFAAKLYGAFDSERALGLAAHADRWYRAPANEGYEATIDHLAKFLRAAGYGSREGFELELLESELGEPAWTPRGARLELWLEGEEPRLLHGFDEPSGRDRVMLPVNAPSADVSGPVAFELDGAPPGSILVTGEWLRGGLLLRAEKRGVAAVLSSALHPFTLDPTGGDRHQDAILFHRVAPGTSLPVAQISPRAHELLRELSRSGRDFRLAFRADVHFEERALRTLVARVVGAERPDEAVAIASHVQEPGAGDNASGIAGLAEAARALALLVSEGALGRPARTSVFLWGDEFRQSSVWLDATSRRAIAGISADMLGQCPERTGAVALLERMPDPGALLPILPDEHTDWGATPVRESDLHPSGLAVVGRVALFDVARVAGGWRTSENPWEGGSDHDVFARRGVPAVLFWHFTDFTYHTSLDRMEMLDGEELRRTTAAVLATALAVADAREADLPRYLASVELERALRVFAARAAGHDDLATKWEHWCDGAAAWLRALCVPVEPAGER